MLKQLLSGGGDGVKWTKIITIWTLLIVCSLGQAKTNVIVNTEIYMVKFTKSSLEMIKNNLINKKILTQLQFLQKLVRNRQELLAQQFQYVSFTVKSSPSNFSNLTQNIKNNSTQIANPKPPTIVNPATTTTSQKINTTSMISSNINNNTKNPQPGQPSQNINITSNINTIRNVSVSANTSTSSSIIRNLSAQTSTTTTIKTNTTATTPPPTLTPPTTTIPSNPGGAPINAANRPKLRPQVNNTIVSKQFTGIGLYHDIPTTFAVGESFKFSGMVTDPTIVLSSPTSLGSSFNFVNIIFSRIQSNQQIKCIQKISKNNLQFQVACPLDTVGSYYLSVFAGQSGYSSRLVRKIVQPPKIIPNATIPPKPQSLFLQIGNSQGDLFVNWFVVSALTKVVFSQRQLSLQYTVSNYAYRLRVPHADFILFQQGPTNVTISHANSKDGTYLNINSYFGQKMYLTFQACEHKHSNTQDENVVINPPIPWQMNINQQFKINAVFKTDAQNQVYIVTPYNQIFKLYFNPQNSDNKGTTFKAGTPVSLTIKFAIRGPNLIQINQDTGLALVNRPLYVGNVYPLMPDYIDLKTAAILIKTDTKSVLQKYVQSTSSKPVTIKQPPLSASLQAKKQYMFDLLNLLRTRQIIMPVQFDTKLNAIAQAHSDDMKKNNYFSHINLQGEGPGERAKRFGFSGAIGENIAQSSTLTEAHLSLQRSAAHFQNSISKMWTRVGIGIVETTFGQQIVTFQFSARDIVKYPLQRSQFQAYQKQLIGMILRKFPNIKSQNRQVSALILEWMSGPRYLQLMPYLITRNVRSLMTTSLTRFNFYPQFVAQIEKQDNVFGNIARYSQVGANIGVSKTDPTIIQCYFIFLA